MLRFSCQKGPKLAQNEVFQISWKVSVWNFSDLLLEVRYYRKPMHWTFLIFLHGVTGEYRLSLMEMFFGGITSFWSFWAKRAGNGPKIKFKSNAWNFSDFLLEVTEAERLKIDSNDFYRKWPKMSFLSFIRNWCIKFFQFVA